MCEGVSVCVPQQGIRNVARIGLHFVSWKKICARFALRLVSWNFDVAGNMLSRRDGDGMGWMETGRCVEMVGWVDRGPGGDGQAGMRESGNGKGGMGW